MIRKTLSINNESGLHARPATKFVKFASGFSSEVIIEMDGNEIDAKSIVSILTAGISSGSLITLRVEGEDEEEAATQIAEFIDTLEG